MKFQLQPLAASDSEVFISDMQEAFQKGAEEAFGETGEEILPRRDVEENLKEPGAHAFSALSDGKPVGGAIVTIDEKTQHNHLDFLFVKTGVQSQGIGKAIFRALEELYPETRVWETVTPYFEKRNIHFYVNVLGFYIVEFFNPFHPDPHRPESAGITADEYFEGMFRFEKEEDGALLNEHVEP